MTARLLPTPSADRSSVSVTEQHWDPERYRRHAGFVPELGRDVLQWLAPQPGERVLDLGCGDGALTAELAKICATVCVDRSAAQVEAARRLGLDARVADGAALAFEPEFDAVFSNAALHWMRDPDAVIASVWRALKPGGRFVAEMGGEGNVAAVIGAMESVLSRRGIDARAAMPWYFPSPAEYRARLEAAGFRVERMRLLPRPTHLPGALAAWLDTFAESFLALVAAADRETVTAEIEAALSDRLYDAETGWTVDYVRLRFAAMKPI